jgi:pimeloyl-ACP methyl ester carboxylesterase
MLSLCYYSFTLPIRLRTQTGIQEIDSILHCHAGQTPWSVRSASGCLEKREWSHGYFPFRRNIVWTAKPILVRYTDSQGCAEPAEELHRHAQAKTVQPTCPCDNTEDLKKFDIPTLIIHGDDDQIVPIADSALLSSKIVKGATLKVYPGAPHGLTLTHKEQFNADLLAFLRS